ncbi:aldose 1-epimerase family protein [Devosia sp. RR2S18]|uniref:aldose 1-epimerase family protein n=1 Tax=Devosia rhizosphaerae TaxID=3049774 RepID=UPI00254010B5|nr:aldose 1-epimerase family protein [Devosia sp. RR2S18]WIJ25738.1 aldose 1-epimerase family protein [Devosia sp. RR2S18]
MNLVTIASDQLSVAISPLGAEMQRLTTSDGRDWLWDGDPAFWTGRAPILFPIVGKAPNDQVRIEGELYPMGQHGFARRTEFDLVSSEASSCRFELSASGTTKSIYPFSFRLTLDYRVEERSVHIAAVVENRDEQPMPFGFGFHPAFLWPLPGCEGEPHWVRLDNSAEPAMVRLAAGLVKPERLPSPFEGGDVTVQHAFFDADAMIFPDGAGTGARFQSGETAVQLGWHNLPNFALWSKPGEAPFLCLEPWHGMAAEVDGSDRIEDRPFTTVLEAGKSAQFGLRVELVG